MTSPSPRLRFIVLTCRDPRADFRLALVESLRRLGHEVVYVRLARHPVVSDPGSGSPALQCNLFDCFRYLRRLTRDRSRVNVYFVSTNLVLPSLVLALEAICAPGLWCFDMHDDLLYSLRGAARLRAYLTQLVLLPTFDLIVHAAPTLQELFPRSRHLGNASAMKPLQRTALDYASVLILASIDERMDFALLGQCATACPAVRFDIHGQVNSATRPTLQRLTDSHANVHHLGAYTLDDLASILGRYAVMLAPYRRNMRLTRYIDPLRFYHALNSGMEILSTEIPQAEVFHDRLHLVRGASDFVRILNGLATGEARRKNAAGKPLVTWDQRAAQLIDILMGVSRMRDLCRVAACEPG